MATKRVQLALLSGFCISIWACQPAFAQSNDGNTEATTQKLRASMRSGGTSEALKTLRDIVSTEPQTVSSTDNARTLSMSFLAALGNDASKETLAEVLPLASRIIVSAAPSPQRGDIAAAVTEAFISSALNVRLADHAVPALAVAAAPVPARKPASSQPDLAAGERAALAVLGSPAGKVPAPVAGAADERARVTTDQVKPIRVGSFLFYPDVTVSGVYDSNIFATRNDRVSDFVGVVSPFAEIESGWSRHLLRAEAGAELGRFETHESEDYTDWWAETEGRLDIGEKHNLFGGINYQRFHESRESQDGVTGLVPTTYNSLSSYAGTTLGFGKSSLRVSGSYQALHFNPVETSTGIVDNVSRDRQMYTGGARLTVQTGRGTQFFVQGSADVRRYDAELDTVPYDRDSHGVRLNAGLAIQRPGQFSLEVFGGFLQQNYDDSRFATAKAPVFGVDFNWDAGPLTNVRLSLNRSLLETTLDDASGVLSTAATFNIQQIIGNRWQAISGVTWRRGDYQGIDRVDNVVNANAGFRYLINRHFYLETSANYRHLHSSTVFEDYDRNQFVVRIGYQPYASPAGYQAWRVRPGHEPGTPYFGGIYAGMQVGYGALNTTVEGPRAEVEAVTANQGDDGAVWGFLVGYGHMLNDELYAGIEFDGITSGARWTFDRGAAIRQFSERSRLSYGASGLLGMVVRDRMLLFARAGIARAEFISRYTFGLVELDQDFSRTGLRLGAGLSYAADDHLRVRAEFTATDYRPFAVDYETGVDTFDNQVTGTRFSLIYGF